MLATTITAKYVAYSAILVQTHAPLRFNFHVLDQPGGAKCFTGVSKKTADPVRVHLGAKAFHVTQVVQNFHGRAHQCAVPFSNNI